MEARSRTVGRIIGRIDQRPHYFQFAARSSYLCPAPGHTVRTAIAKYRSSPWICTPKNGPGDMKGGEL